MKTLLLIDSHALIHRSYHALPPLTAPDGKPVGALYGLASTLLKIFREVKPDYIAAAFDRPEPTFRKKEFDDYKAHRAPLEDELITQLQEARILFDAFGIPILDCAGYEADDVIGTAVKQLSSNKNLKTVILTGDLDTLQLVLNDTVIVETFGRGIRDTRQYNEKAVIARFGVSPKQIPDFKGLVGDVSDNIPGVKGVGPKTAAELLANNATLEKILENPPKHNAMKKVLPLQKTARLSKQLATIHQEVPITLSLERLLIRTPDHKKLSTYFVSLGFNSLVDRLTVTHEDSAQKKVEVPKVGKIENCLVFVNTGEINKKKMELTSDVLKVTFNWKEFYKYAIQKDITIKPPILDIQIAAWLLRPDNSQPTLKSIADRFLRQSNTHEKELGELYKSISAALRAELDTQGLRTVLETIEMPLVPILARMELWGIEVDGSALSELSNTLENELSSSTKSIYTLAGGEFNINSPKQVGDVLFSKLSLSVGGKRKTTAKGQLKTDRESLEALRNSHPIVPLLLEYRENFKIKSGFVDPLKTSMELDGRVRTTFIQTGTATGRLASEKPNVQNIPHESRWAPYVRNAFRSSAGWSLISIDYAQLELKLLAHLSNSKSLINAFRAGCDIHALTASKIYGVSLSAVTPEQRRSAKTMNFGLIYGMGARSLAAAGGMTVQDAKKFIEEYFRNFPEVKIWQESVRKNTARNGFVENINGRRRWFAHAGGGSLRGDIERQVINMPIQSFGADIMKLAMIGTFSIVQHHNTANERVRLLLSIHDELLFEVHDDILSEIAPLLAEKMEHVYNELSVPLTVEVRVGKRWGSLQKL